MSDLHPKISIITATYNCQATLAACLDSVTSQTWDAKEHIIIDGASTDGTLALLGQRRSHFSAFVSEPDRGIYDALNKGIAIARGDVIGFLHSDDVFANNGILAAVAKAFLDSNVVAVYGDLVYVASEDTKRVIRYWRSGDFVPESLHRGWMPPHPTLYLRRSLYEKLGNFDLSYKIAADYDFMLRLLSQIPKGISYLPQVLVKMRTGGASNRSIRQIWNKSREDYRALQANRIGGFRTLARKNFSKLHQFVTTWDEVTEQR